ncbi:MAG: hypothetical protein Udaeo2_16460 [Candidatus Udaeobacter sp.]|nr:MAG: hypothetical protein Udaeo2_16460 [Candidatus Udaeobacter sp.]
MLDRENGFLLSLAGQDKRITAVGAIESSQKVPRLAREFHRIDPRMSGNRKGQRHAGNRGVHAGFVHEIPESNSSQQIWPQAADPHDI